MKARPTDSDSSDDSDYASPDAIKSRLQPSVPDDSHPLEQETSPKVVDDPASNKPKMVKAAQKRAKKAAAVAATVEASEDKFNCASCNAGFPSKTRLFQHIKDFGHAAPKEVGGGQSKGKKGKR